MGNKLSAVLQEDKECVGWCVVFLNLKTSTITFYPEVTQKCNIKVLTARSVTQPHLVFFSQHQEQDGWGGGEELKKHQSFLNMAQSYCI